MRRNWLVGLFLAFQLPLAASWSSGQDVLYSIATGPAPSAAGLPAPFADALEPQAIRLLSVAGREPSPVYDVWFSRAIPAQEGTGAARDVVYGNLKPGVLVGVVRFFAKADDSMDQDLRPGFYTMRYAQMPADGNHIGVSRYRDFVVLSPVKADTRINEALKFDDLLKLSRQASGTLHPAVMSLLPVNLLYKNFPAALADDRGSCTLQVKLHEKLASGGQGQEVPVAVLLVNPPNPQGS